MLHSFFRKFTHVSPKSPKLVRVIGYASSILAVGAIIFFLRWSIPPPVCDNVLMIRSGMADFGPDPGVVPDEMEQVRYGIRVIYTKYHHTNMTDSGPPEVKKEIAKIVEQFLIDNERCP